MSLVILSVAILFEVAATISLKKSEGLTRRRWIPAVVAGYVISFALLALVLEYGVPIGIAYGIWAAAGVACTAVAGRVLFKESLTRVMGLGIVAIVLGVLTIEIGGH